MNLLEWLRRGSPADRRQHVLARGGDADLESAQRELEHVTASLRILQRRAELRTLSARQRRGR